MCGILLNFNTNGINTKLFEESLNLQIHRGPDSQEIYCSNIFDNKAPYKINQFKQKNLNNPLFMSGFNRLSILDLSKNSNQPIINNEKNKMLLYNGEFYNYLDYSNEYNKKSDSLTLFDLLNNFDSKALNLINGMWAICYIDFINRTILFSRDRYGKKPLFYYHDKDQLIVSSEYKSIFHLLKRSRSVSLDSLAYFMIGKLSPYKDINNNSFYKDIKSFEPGSVNIFNFDKNLFLDNQKTQIDFPNENISRLSNNEIKEQIYKDFKNAVEKRLTADTKIGVMLSGGIDSSSIAGIVSKSKQINEVEFFTANIFRQNEVTPDTKYANYLSKKLGIKLNIIDVDPKSYTDFIKNAFEITKYTELPNNFSLASIPTYLITKSMKEKNFKVSLDGIGGDEIFGGYPSSLQSLSIANIQNSNYYNSILYFLKWSQYYSPSLFVKLKFLLSLIIRSKHINLKKDYHNNNLFSKINFIKNGELIKKIKELEKNFFIRNKLCSIYERQNFEIKNFQIPYYTGVADNLSMANSVENRSPFLDLELNKYINLKDNLKFNKGKNKYIFREVIGHLVPKKISQRIGDYGIGTCYDEAMLDSAKSIDIILDSNFIRNLMSESLIKADFLNNKIFTRSLFSIAVLDHTYNLSL